MKRKFDEFKKLPYISIVLVALNVIIFLICTFTGNLLYNVGGLSPDSFLDGNQYYRIVSAMFLHADINHLVNNMLLLAGLGAMLEKETGHIRFLLLYTLAGLSGQIVSLLYKMFTGGWFIISIGASGAVFGLVGTLLAMSLWWPRKMDNVTWQRILFVIGYTIYSGVQAANIDNAAHIGGLLAGFLCGLIMCLFQKLYINRRNRNVHTGRWE